MASSNSPDFDVIIIGSGMAGALCATRLAPSGARILILEAGKNGVGGFQREQFHRVWDVAPAKSWNTPYLGLPGSRRFYPSPGSNDKTYFEQPNTTDGGKENPEKLFKAYYQRLAGGTAWTWRGNSPRFVPNDFRLNSEYGLPVPDWPMSYDDLEPWYCEAEAELGVAGDEEEWNDLLGAHRSREFPMTGQPKSYSDKVMIKALGQQKVKLGGETFAPILITTPQARNTRPYQGRPACEGNSNCIPLCPIGAKYDSSIHLRQALLSGVEIRSACVVTRLAASTGGAIQTVHFKSWDSANPTQEQALSARIVILAANAIESPKILLESRLATASGQVGRNLMDHVQGEVVATYEPTALYPFRGPQSICGIEVFRDGVFRTKHGAFRMTLGNDGWGRAGNPTTVLEDLIPPNKASNFHIGADLREKLVHKATRLIRFGFSTEQLPYFDNRVELSAETDLFGIRRPKITYSVEHDYTRTALLEAHRVATELFGLMGAEVEKGESEILDKDGKLRWNTAAHIMGTCRMGKGAEDSVVDSYGRCHEHPNLFVVGSSVFPTGATANPTLTIAALALRTAAAVAEELKGAAWGSATPNTLCRDR